MKFSEILKKEDMEKYCRPQKCLFCEIRTKCAKLYTKSEINKNNLETFQDKKLSMILSHNRKKKLKKLLS